MGWVAATIAAPSGCTSGGLVARLGSIRGKGVLPGSKGDGGPKPMSSCLMGGMMGGL